jgi:hypothetical protein
MSYNVLADELVRNVWSCMQQAAQQFRYSTVEQSGSANQHNCSTDIHWNRAAAHAIPACLVATSERRKAKNGLAA